MTNFDDKLSKYTEVNIYYPIKLIYFILLLYHKIRTFQMFNKGNK